MGNENSAKPHVTKQFCKNESILLIQLKRNFYTDIGYQCLGLTLF